MRMKNERQDVVKRGCWPIRGRQLRPRWGGFGTRNHFYNIRKNCVVLSAIPFCKCNIVKWNIWTGSGGSVWRKSRGKVAAAELYSPDRNHIQWISTSAKLFPLSCAALTRNVLSLDLDNISYKFSLTSLTLIYYG